MAKAFYGAIDLKDQNELRFSDDDSRNASVLGKI